MTALPRLSGRRALAALERGGFALTHIRGSHHYLRKPNVSALVVVPVHGNHDLPAGTLRAILRQTGLTTEEFVALL